MRPRGKRLTLLLATLAVVALGVAGWVCWPQLRFHWLFERLAGEVDGRPRYRHRHSGAVFIRFASDRGAPDSWFSFDGRDGYVEVPDSPSLRFHEGASVGCWLFLEEAKEGTILNRWHMGREDLILRVRADNRGTFDLYVDGHVNVAVTTVGPLPTRQWLHIAGTYDGAFMRIYVDGAIEGEKEEGRGILNAPCSLRIGAVRRDGTVWPSIKGRVAQVALFNRGLSREEVQYLKAGLAPSSDGGLAAYYIGGGEEVVPDLSGQGNDGMLAPAREPEQADLSHGGDMRYASP